MPRERVSVLYSSTPQEYTNSHGLKASTLPYVVEITSRPATRKETREFDQHMASFRKQLGLEPYPQRQHRRRLFNLTGFKIGRQPEVKQSIKPQLSAC